MADKNRNGIDDRYEPKGFQPLGFGSGKQGPQVEQPQSGMDALGALLNRSVTDTVVGGARNLLNFGGDVGAGVLGQPTQQFGAGDRVFGKPTTRMPIVAGKGDRGRPTSSGGRIGGGRFGGGGENPLVEDEGFSFADYLQQAQDILGGQGGGGVNYDPQRQTLRGNAAEGDARLEAMYRQLRGSIDADAPVLQQTYQTAIDNTAQNSQQAQAQTQAATDAANARNNEVLANLGIQQAQGNIIQEGRDLNTQAAAQIGDQATRGQAAGDRLVSNQATALQHNTNIGNAAGLEGNLQRAQNQARLQALLSEIDMQEQQANASQGTDLSEAMTLASEMFGVDQYNQDRRDKMEMTAAELAAQGMGEQEAPLPGLDDFLQAMAQRGIKIPEDPRDLSSLLDAMRRYSFE